VSCADAGEGSNFDGGWAHEGALKISGKCGQSNYKAAYGQIHWWLKRRWARLTVITAIETRYAGLGYAGDSALQQAAAFHAQAQARTTCAKMARTASAKKKLPLPSLGGSVADKPLW
jgi:hypothetical protein